MFKKYNPKKVLIKGQRFIEDKEKSKLQPEKAIGKVLKVLTSSKH